MLWAWGQISPQLVQHMMALFKDDLQSYSSPEGMSMDFVDMLVRLGQSGTHTGNVHRDLVRNLPGSHMPHLHYFMIPLKHKITESYDAAMPMMLPHELFASMFHNYKDAFFTYIIPDDDAVASFWKSVQGTYIMCCLYCIVHI